MATGAGAEASYFLFLSPLSLQSPPPLHFDSTLGVCGIGKSTVLKLVREVSGRVLRFDLSTPVFMVPEAAGGEAQGD
jgi:hypothetical protein